MKIGIDTHAAENEGEGNSTYIRNLLLHLKKIDRDNLYFFYGIDTRNPFYENFESNNNITITRLSSKNPLIRIPLQLSRHTFSDALDILHVQYISPPMFRGRLVVTIHDLCYLHHPESFSKFETFRSRILIKTTARRARKVITGSLFSKNDIADKFRMDPQKIQVIPTGVSSLFDNHRDPKKAAAVLRKHRIHKPYILFVGRLNPRKNILTLIKVFAALRRSHALPHQLVIVGKDDYRTEDMMQAVRENRLESSLVFAGLVSDDDLPHLYRGSEIFVYPSLFEGVGLPVLEAMKSGTPVISSNTTSLKEIVGDAGLTVNPLCSEELSAALVRMLYDRDLRNACINKGLARAEESTWDFTARKTLAVYNEITRPRIPSVRRCQDSPLSNSSYSATTESQS